jgi:hypothetical protein
MFSIAIHQHRLSASAPHHPRYYIKQHFVAPQRMVRARFGLSFDGASKRNSFQTFVPL